MNINIYSLYKNKLVDRYEHNLILCMKYIDIFKYLNNIIFKINKSIMYYLCSLIFIKIHSLKI